MQDKDYALVIGLNDYPEFMPLAGPITDAEKFFAWVSKEDGGGVPQANCRLIRSAAEPDKAPSPLQYEVDRAIFAFIKQIKQTTEQKARRFYFYFAGHGLGLSTEGIGLCLPDWSKDFRQSALLSNDYLTAIQKYGLFEEIFFFLDCCRVSDVGGGSQIATFHPILPSDDSGATQTCIAAAAEYQGKAFEGVVSAAGVEIRGFFTTALLEALDSKTAVSLKQLEPFVYKRTLELTNAKNLVQQPRFTVNFSKDTSTVFFGKVKPMSGSTDPLHGVKGDVLGVVGLESSKKRAKFTISVPLTRETEVSLFNAQSELLHKDFENFSAELPEGEYTVIMQRLGKMEMDKINHTVTGTTFIVPQLSTQTPVLLAGAEFSHEYYTDNAVRCSTHPTSNRGPIGGSAESSFFLFARYESKDQVPQGGSPFPKFTLLDESLNIAKEFSDTCVEKDDQYGWLAFSNRAKSGQYYLRFEAGQGGEHHRIIPIYLFPGWQTQVFVALSERKPVFNGIRLLMARPDAGFTPYDEEPKKTDFAYKCLQDPSMPIPPSILEWLLYGHYANPIYGMLGAYLLAQRPAEEIPDKMNPKELLPQVALRLLYLTESIQSPDIQAIFMLAGIEPKEGKPVFTHPPMFDFGADKVIEYATEGKKASIAPDAVIEKIAASRISDLAVVCWEQKIGAPALPSQPEQWVLNSLEAETLKAKKMGISLDLQTLARAFRLPKTTIEEAARFMLSKDTGMTDTLRTGIEQLLKPIPISIEK
ncbi:MAG: caspase family protein [Saprospiraceae bacterium]